MRPVNGSEAPGTGGPRSIRKLAAAIAVVAVFAWLFVSVYGTGSDLPTSEGEVSKARSQAQTLSHEITTLSGVARQPEPPAPEQLAALAHAWNAWAGELGLSEAEMCGWLRANQGDVGVREVMANSGGVAVGYYLDRCDF